MGIDAHMVMHQPPLFRFTLKVFNGQSQERAEILRHCTFPLTLDSGRSLRRMSLPDLVSAPP